MPPVIITCGVLTTDIRHVLAQLQVEARLVALPGGLHEDPAELKRRLQAEIVKADATGPDRIILGYGVCGRGTVGLTAEHAPLVIPRVHDCIALFLGSDKEYRNQFAKQPGTYYVSAGWVNEKTEPLRQVRGTSPRPDHDAKAEQELIDLYGEDNADAIRHFFNSWQRNYQRAAFIDTGTQKKNERYERIARDMAKRFGWNYERIEGSHHLLEQMLTTSCSTAEILVVPPGETTYYDALNRRIASGIPGMTPHADDADEAPAPTRPDHHSATLTLGIDAGGTYTDAALFTPSTRSVEASAKAPTTRWNLAIGIREAIVQLPPARRAEVGLVCLSTTLATNAIVEGQGQPVGLIVMPPYGRFDSRRFNHEPVVPVNGRLEIDGSVIQDIDPAQIRKTAIQLAEKHKVAAFAIAGYASHANPDHEIRVAEIVKEATGMPVTCGHEVSAGLNYRIKAETAALNARIIPCLAALLNRVESTLSEFDITAPVMVVRSDGSLMSIQTALKHPVQTIMSGPAASVAGAIELTGEPDAIIVDIGGTTTDTAIVTTGRTRISEQGATVGSWKTHVKALEMRTLGLGGDSRISLHADSIELGPRRVLPFCRTAARGIERALGWLETRADLLRDAPDAVDILLLASPDQLPEDLTDREKKLTQALQDGPLTVQQLSLEAGLVNWRLVRTESLETRGILLRCGLTPTDVLHALGTLSLWDTDTARRACELFARAANAKLEPWLHSVNDTFTHALARALIKTQLAQHVEPDAIDDCAPANDLLRAALGSPLPGLDVGIRLTTPVIGIGAPASCFVPQVAKLLSTRAVVPEHAQAANAVGAAASHVVVSQTVALSTDENGAYRLSGVKGAPRFDTLDQAETHAISELSTMVLDSARQAGTSATHVDIAHNDRVTTLTDGASLFIERRITATVAGSPDLSTPIAT